MYCSERLQVSGHHYQFSNSFSARPFHSEISHFFRPIQESLIWYDLQIKSHWTAPSKESLIKLFWRRVVNCGASNQSLGYYWQSFLQFCLMRSPVFSRQRYFPLQWRHNERVGVSIFRQPNVVAWWKFAWVYPIRSSIKKLCCSKIIGNIYMYLLHNTAV